MLTLLGLELSFCIAQGQSYVTGTNRQKSKENPSGS